MRRVNAITGPRRFSQRSICAAADAFRATPWPTHDIAARVATLKEFTATFHNIDWGVLSRGLDKGHGTPDVTPFHLDATRETAWGRPKVM